MQLEELKARLAGAKWQDEVKLVHGAYLSLRPISVRQLALKLDKSKTWIQTSLTLARALPEMPELVKCTNRYQAYREILRANRLREFLQ